MAVSGVRVADSEREAWFDGLMFWGVQYRRLPLWTLLRGAWLGALIAGVVGTAFLPIGILFRGGAGLHGLLGWVVLVHLLARGWVERRLPDPSFLNDLRTGNFEQLRLTPHTAHTLLVQRGLPDLLFRALTMSLWLPLYALIARVLGLSFLDGAALWLLFSFANYFVLGLVSLALLASAWAQLDWVLGLGLLGYAFLLDGGRTRTAVANSSLFAVMLALPILGRVLLPTQWLFALPDLRGFALMWLLIEMLRFERMARWVNLPSGVWRWFYLLPSAGLMAFVGAFVWQQSGLMGYSGAEQTQLMAISLVVAAGYLHLLLLTVRRQSEPIVQPLRAHLLESAWLRLLSLLLIGSAVALWGLPAGSAAFWGVLVWLSVVEWVGGACFRWWLQRAHSRAPGWAYGGVLLGLSPAVLFLVAPSMTAIGGLSPLFALLMASNAWRAARVAVQPPLWLCLTLPLARYVLTLLVLGVATTRTAQPSRRTQALLSWLALPLLYPLWDWLVRRQASNPITRLTIAERQPPYALLLGVTAAALGAFSDLASAGWAIFGIIPLGIFLWLWGYYTSARRVRRWIDSGELTSAFLAGLQPNQIFWGWVYGAWQQQLRVLLSTVVGFFLGMWLSAFFAPPVVGGMGGAWVVFMLLGLQGGIWLFTLALWSCAWLIAAPAAIRDQLTAQQGAAPLLTPRAALQAAFATLLACCTPLAPFLLIGLPIYASQSTIALHRLARAPAEPARPRSAITA